MSFALMGSELGSLGILENVSRAVNQPAKSVPAHTLASRPRGDCQPHTLTAVHFEGLLRCPRFGHCRCCNDSTRCGALPGGHVNRPSAHGAPEWRARAMPGKLAVVLRVERGRGTRHHRRLAQHPPAAVLAGGHLPGGGEEPLQDLGRLLLPSVLLEPPAGVISPRGCATTAAL